eukprot:TRINITY_DN9788_c0_g1_i1.p1 TRINITY_DN9788_c0_g1~~TRINITY_DN9788_c0_g1_i1.p1  ORF type:complete len:439 (+),score=104.57 TRINITY_DN9788_c0_g1_i1:191-1318(+)
MTPVCFGVEDTTSPPLLRCSVAHPQDKHAAELQTELLTATASAAPRILTSHLKKVTGDDFVALNEGATLFKRARAVVRHAVQANPQALFDPQHTGILQLAFAAAEALGRSSVAECGWEDAHAAEKEILASFYEQKEHQAKPPIVALNLLSELLDLAARPTATTKPAFSFEAILSLAVFLYSLVDISAGEVNSADSNSDDSDTNTDTSARSMKKNMPAAIEQRFYNLLHLRSGNDAVKLSATENAIKILRVLSQCRSSLQDYPALTNAAGAISPLSAQLMHSILIDRKELHDLKHLTAFTLGNILKSGWRALGLTSSKPRPNASPVIFLLLLGGVCALEISEIQKVVQQQSRVQVIIIATSLATPSSIVRHLFGTE